jgi:hypothetical protein
VNGTRAALHRSPFDVGEDLLRVDQEDRAGGGQPHTWWVVRSINVTPAPFQTLQPLAQRGLDDVLCGRRPDRNATPRPG